MIATGIADHVLRYLDLPRENVPNTFDEWDALTLRDCPAVLTEKGLRDALWRIYQGETGWHNIEIYLGREMVQKWAYHEVFHEDGLKGAIVQIPDSLEVSEAIPTSIENILVTAWNSDEAFFDDRNLPTPNTIVSAWAEGIPDNIKKMSLSLCNVNPYALDTRDDMDCSNYESLHWQKQFDERAKYLQDIFIEANNQNIIKWRFLEFYRILENIYLWNINNNILNDFMKNPAQVLTIAQTALSSERNQLFSVAETSGTLAVLFEEIVDINKSLTTNRFACAIQKELSDRNKTGENKAQHGASIVYQVRCAIVHAGESSIYFEKYDDARVAIKKILAPIEKICHELVGVLPKP